MHVVGTNEKILTCPSLSQPAPSLAPEAAAAINTVNHNNETEHPSGQDIPSNPVDVARAAASTAVSNMKTLASPLQGVASAINNVSDPTPCTDLLSSILKALHNFNNVVDGIATASTTYFLRLCLRIHLMSRFIPMCIQPGPSSRWCLRSGFRTL